MDDLKQRTRDYGVAVVRLFTSLPKSPEAQVLGRQLLRSGTSVGANFAKALADAHERNMRQSSYWPELLEGAGIQSGRALEPLRKETNELSAIFVALIRRSKQS
ncbi:MAG TPA: four helix bundle protein [Candidatus Acidoferrum sp.]|nr:four helix bundle protein [Candidatus Acidoferrum sp.]